MNLAWLLRSMLENAARQKVREKVLQAAQEQLADRTQTADAAAADRRCDVAILCALRMELGGVEEMLADVVTIRGQDFVIRRGTLRGRHVAIIVGGVGRTAAAQAAEAILGVYTPRWVISAGFAGGLCDELPRRHLLVADCVRDVEGHALPIDISRFPAELRNLEPVHVGTLLTADRIIRREEEKRLLGVAHQALAVDMETLAVAEVCRRRNVPLLAVRVISDAVDDELPADVDRLLRKKGSRRLGAALGAIVNRPGSLKDMLKLQDMALAASARLAKYLARLIRQLVPPGAEAAPKTGGP